MRTISLSSLFLMRPSQAALVSQQAGQFLFRNKMNTFNEKRLVFVVVQLSVDIAQDTAGTQLSSVWRRCRC